MPVKFGENVLSERKVGLLWVFIFFMENKKTPVKDGSVGFELNFRRKAPQILRRMYIATYLVRKL
ncbi:MAG: hypothetical protein IJF13_01620, partial [Clostridia bacterium]|nr:hypothetical protein [Clostridia bacterium]